MAFTLNVVFAPVRLTSEFVACENSHKERRQSPSRLGGSLERTHQTTVGAWSAERVLKRSHLSVAKQSTENSKCNKQLSPKSQIDKSSIMMKQNAWKWRPVFEVVAELLVI